MFIHYRPHDSMLCMHIHIELVVKEIKSSFFVLCMQGMDEIILKELKIHRHVRRN